MDLQPELAELRAAWRALSGSDAQGEKGWATIRVAAGLPLPIRAGRSRPGNVEALLFGFRGSLPSFAVAMPSAAGFSVHRAELDDVDRGWNWIAIRRDGGASLDLFETMIVDLFRVARQNEDRPAETLPGTLLARIRGWQDFMKRAGSKILGAEREIGLFGELATIVSLLDLGLAAAGIIDSWQGPEDALHDFRIGSGVIEVKAAVSGLHARIGSLDQLDDGLVSPLILAFVLLRRSDDGCTLPELAASIATRLQDDVVTLRRFELKLMQAGFLQQFADLYSTCLGLVKIDLHRVESDFPRLTNATVPAGIRQASYEIDLASIRVPPITLNAALTALGALTDDT